MERSRRPRGSARSCAPVIRSYASTYRARVPATTSPAGPARRGLVPRLAFQPVARELLVKACLWTPRLIGRSIPESRRIGRQDLVDQDRIDGPTVAPSSARPNSNFVSASRMPRRSVTADAKRVEPQGAIPDRLPVAAWPSARASRTRGRPSSRSSMFSSCSPSLGLGRRREDRLRKSIALAQAGRQRDPADRAAASVCLPARARQVAADDGLDRDHVDPAGRS